MKVIQSLRAVTSYPVSVAVVENICEAAGLETEAEAAQELRRSKQYKAALASVYRFLATAPNVTQAGISYTLSESDKERYRKMAESLSDEAGDETGASMAYGYVGDNY